MAKVIVRDAFSERVPYRLMCKKPGRTKQEFKDECDINVIMRRYEKAGMLPELIQSNPGVYGDFSGAEDFKTCLDTVMIAQEQFMALDAKIRSRFDNDPSKMLAWVENPDESILSKADAIKHGLLKAPVVEAAPQKVEIVNQKVEGK